MHAPCRFVFACVAGRGATRRYRYDARAASATTALKRAGDTVTEHRQRTPHRDSRLSLCVLALAQLHITCESYTTAVVSGVAHEPFLCSTPSVPRAERGS